MGLSEWWRDLRDTATRPRWDGRSGTPPSGNGASSFHLFWDAPQGRWTSVEATIEIIRPPSVDRLYFWAMQVSFEAGGRPGGAGHIGPQWCTNPVGPAVNWGGYSADGGELRGSESALPSAWNNVNTRDYPWRAGAPYRLRVHAPAGVDAPAGFTAWRGEIDDLTGGDTTVVRELYAKGDVLTSPMVWSEVFAACDEPSVVVRWSDLTLLDVHGERLTVESVRVNYQTLGDGGCVTTDVGVDARGFVQTTGTARTTPQGAALRLSSG